MCKHTKKLAAEMAGTMILVMSVVGSGIMATRLSPDGALQLLCNSIATGTMLVVLITLLGPISGAHFNPLVSMAFWLRRQMSSKMMAGYCLAQIIGGIIGIILTHLMFEQPLLQIATTHRTGTGLWIAEIIASASLLWVIMLGVHYAKDRIGLLVGLYVTAAYWFTASTSFANPAVTIARTLTNSFAGLHPDHIVGFILAQLLGGLIGVSGAIIFLPAQE